MFKLSLVLLALVSAADAADIAPVPGAPCVGCRAVVPGNVLQWTGNYAPLTTGQTACEYVSATGTRVWLAANGGCPRAVVVQP
jgi:hypothetical protein